MYDFKEDVFNILSSVTKINKDLLMSIDINTDLKSYGLDSLKAIELFAKLENDLNIVFDYDDLTIENVCTINNLKQTLKRAMYKV